MSEMNPKVILGFIIVAVIGFYVAAALLPGAIAEYYSGVTLLSWGDDGNITTGSNVTAWMTTLMLIAPIGVPIGLLAIFIFAGMKYLGKD